jgi:hypothetical protein
LVPVTPRHSKVEAATPLTHLFGWEVKFGTPPLLQAAKLATAMATIFPSAGVATPQHLWLVVVGNQIAPERLSETRSGHRWGAQEIGP